MDTTTGTTPVVLRQHDDPLERGGHGIDRHALGNRRFLDRSQVPTLAFGEERYIVMAVDDLTAPPDVGNGEPLTATQAHQLLADYLVAHPQDRARLEVVPTSEVPG